MGISKTFKEKMNNLSPEDVNRMVRMGWEDRTTFEAIEKQFNFNENEFVRFMRAQLEEGAFERWRRRVYLQGHLKQEKLRGFKMSRFKSTRQSDDGVTKGWK